MPRAPSGRRLAPLLACLGLLVPADAGALTGADAARRAAGALHGSVVRDEQAGGARRIRIAVRDERYPLVVDLVGSTSATAAKAVFLLPGGGQTVASSFLTPDGASLADHLAAAGALVVGVTPREAAVPPWQLGRAMAGWGIARHRRDIRAIVTRVQPATGLPYDVLGHSYGATSALDYAAVYDDLERVIALDIASPELGPDPVLARDARRTHAAHVTLIRAGFHADPTYAVLKPLTALAAAAPRASSGWSRRSAGHPGAFTLEGLLYSGLIDSALEPGIHTPLTRLPGDWLMRRGALAGAYTFARDPSRDTYAFTHTPLRTVRTAAARSGSGLIPTAFERDWWALTAGTRGYAIDWAGINEGVVWLNAELGYGNHLYGADLIRQAGNARVISGVIPGYGHADLLWGADAARDVWAWFDEAPTAAAPASSPRSARRSPGPSPSP